MIFGLRRVHAFSLVELTLALGIASICLIAAFGLMPVGVQTNRNATSQTRATNIMAAVIADLRATPPTIPPGGPTTSLQYGIPIPANPVGAAVSEPPLFFAEDGTFSTSIQAQSRYQLNVTFRPTSSNPNGSNTHLPTVADIKTTWPAAATTGNASGSAEMVAAFDRN
jgi:type II secretory pathway pseudopilin PulG